MRQDLEFEPLRAASLRSVTLFFSSYSSMSTCVIVYEPRTVAAD